MVATIIKAILAALTGLANAILPLYKKQFHPPKKSPPSHYREEYQRKIPTNPFRI